jgi:desulfoferrodoxin (superoxide reductase-like protein)
MCGTLSVLGVAAAKVKIATDNEVEHPRSDVHHMGWMSAQLVASAASFCGAAIGATENRSGMPRCRYGVSAATTAVAALGGVAYALLASNHYTELKR